MYDEYQEEFGKSIAGLEELPRGADCPKCSYVSDE